MSASQTPTAVTDASPRIEYRQFQLVDQEASLNLPTGWSRTDAIAIAAGHGVLLRTAGNDFFPDVCIETWIHAPAQDRSEAWDTVEEVDFTSDTGTVRLREWDGGPAGHPIHLGGAGTYRLRAHSRGRAEAEALVGQELYYEGVEEWLLQVWPV